MQVVKLLNLVADQQTMIDTIEDPLDRVISCVLSQTESLADDDLEEVQAASLPYMIHKNNKGDK